MILVLVPLHSISTFQLPIVSLKKKKKTRNRRQANQTRDALAILEAANVYHTTMRFLNLLHRFFLFVTS